MTVYRILTDAYSDEAQVKKYNLSNDGGEFGKSWVQYCASMMMDSMGY